jgi:hypothetical protein
VDDVTGLVAEIRAFRPFLPAKEFETSLRFYKAIGFEAHSLGETLAELSLGTHAFLLQGNYVKEWAENTVMHVLVKDVDAWWRHIDSLALARQFDVLPAAPPKVEPWGLTVRSLRIRSVGCTVALCAGDPRKPEFRHSMISN